MPSLPQPSDLDLGKFYMPRYVRQFSAILIISQESAEQNE